MTAKGGSRELRYCPLCQMAWEFDTAQRRELKHKDFPAFRLPREACSDCKKESHLY